MGQEAWGRGNAEPVRFWVVCAARLSPLSTPWRLNLLWSLEFEVGVWSWKVIAGRYHDRMIIFGVDPGSRVTGWGAIQMRDNRRRCLDFGAIAAVANKDSSFPSRLLRIYQGLRDLLERFHPAAVAVEEVFYAVNVKTALKLGHARGAVLVAAAEAGIPVVEYSPLLVKKSVVGYGRADKAQIQMMVKTLLGLDRLPCPDDASDALAVALCHSFQQPRLSRGRARLMRDSIRR